MHPAQLIAAAVRSSSPELLPDLPCEPSSWLCAVIGEELPCIPRRHAIPPSCCDQGALQAPLSQWVSVDVYQAWNFGETKEGRSRQSCPERQACWWCDGREFRAVKRQEIREIVLHGSPSTPWAMWVTTSYKKHGSIRARTNTDARGIVAMDERIIDCSDAEQVAEWWGRLNGALAAGIGRTVLESMDCPAHIMRAAGLQTWLDFERWARPRYQSALYGMLCYLLPSKEEREGDEKQEEVSFGGLFA